MEVYMKFYCLKNKNGNYSIRAKLDGIMTEFARLSKREMAANAEVRLPNKDNRCKTVQSKGFLSLEEELTLSPEDAEELFSYLQKTLDDINATEFSKLRELQRSKSVEKTVAEIISGIAERGARWNNNIQKQYQDKLKSYSKEPKEQLTIDDI